MNSQTDRPFPTVEGVNVTHRFIDIGGLKVHVAEAGEGEPLIMLGPSIGTCGENKFHILQNIFV